MTRKNVMWPEKSSANGTGNEASETATDASWDKRSHRYMSESTLRQSISLIVDVWVNFVNFPARVSYTDAWWDRCSMEPHVATISFIKCRLLPIDGYCQKFICFTLIFESFYFGVMHIFFSGFRLKCQRSESELDMTVQQASVFPTRSF